MSWNKRSPKMTSLTSTKNYTKTRWNKSSNSSQWTWRIQSSSRLISTMCNKSLTSTTATMNKTNNQGRKHLKKKLITIKERTPMHHSYQLSRLKWQSKITGKRMRSCKRMWRRWVISWHRCSMPRMSLAALSCWIICRPL